MGASLDPMLREAMLAEIDRELSRRKIDEMYPESGPLRRELYPKHMEFFKAGADYRERCAMAANRVGKALVHGTRVATPAGWREIETLSPGDLVIAGDGSIVRVLGVYPQGEVDLFALSFDGVHEITTCAEHLWRYLPPAGRYETRHSHGKQQANPAYGVWKVGNTQELTQFKLSSARQRPVVPITKPFSLDAAGQALPIDPYVLGLLLGDGGLSRDSIKFSSADAELVAAIEAHYKVSKYSGYDYGVLGATPDVRELGLLGCTSATKFVPDQYLYADKQARLAVLQGLMDTDGHIGLCNGAMEFSTVSDALADGFEWLAISLGMKVRRVRRHTKSQHGTGQPSWRIVLRSPELCPFRLPRKVLRWKPLQETGDWLLHSVTPAGRGLATCIEVDHPSHTFVIEHGIVTHNTEGMGGYETALHLTGRYPNWWTGRRFEHPVQFWAAGKTNETTRDIVQRKLFGPVRGAGPEKHFDGTGLIYGDSIGKIAWKQGVSDLADTVLIQHVSGGWSELGLKSYQQGRGSFEGTERHGIWLDEEPPLEIYSECLIRTATTDGIVYITFTPLEGTTGTVMMFLQPDTGRKAVH